MKHIHLAAAVTSLFFLATSSLYAQYVDIPAADGNGVRFWSSDAFKIHMGNSSQYHYGPVTDYGIKFNMSTETGRGWTWGNDSQTPIAALSNVGQMQVAKNFFCGTIFVLHNFSWDVVSVRVICGDIYR